MKILKNTHIIKFNLYKTWNGVSKPYTKSKYSSIIIIYKLNIALV